MQVITAVTWLDAASMLSLGLILFCSMTIMGCMLPITVRTAMSVLLPPHMYTQRKIAGFNVCTTIHQSWKEKNKVKHATDLRPNG